MCATLDTYGFALSGMTNDELRGRERCLQRSSSQLAAWKRVLAQRPVHLAGRRVKEMVRRGIPPELRPDVWFALSGAAAMRDSHPTQYYAQLRGCCEDAVEPLDSETYRMFVRILGPEGIATVQRIFAAYRLHRDVDGASLHLAAVVAFLLVVMGPEREEDVFWLFLSLIDNKIYNNKTSYKVHFTLFSVLTHLFVVRLLVSCSGTRLGGIAPEKECTFGRTHPKLCITTEHLRWMVLLFLRYGLPSRNIGTDLGLRFL